MAENGRIDLFGPFVAVSPDERADSVSAGGRWSDPPSSAPREVFDALVSPVASVSGKRQCVTLPCSVALHAAAVVALIAVPLLVSSELPGPSGAVQAFFVEPMVAPPPAPPPPPPSASPAMPSRAVPAPPTDSMDRFTAPAEVPSELRLDEGLDLGIGGGVPGGVAGGVPGGVVGGVVGGLSGAAAGAPPPVAPLRVGGHIKEPTKLRHVGPVYPKVAMAASVQGIVIIEAVIDATGRVAEARVLRGVPMLDEAALEAVRQWEYSPTLLDGVPTPVRMTITVTFRLEHPTRS
jgi:protein TonB